jgi:hypothetical protein
MCSEGCPLAVPLIIASRAATPEQVRLPSLLRSFISGTS